MQNASCSKSFSYVMGPDIDKASFKEDARIPRHGKWKPHMRHLLMLTDCLLSLIRCPTKTDSHVRPVPAYGSKFSDLRMLWFCGSS